MYSPNAACGLRTTQIQQKPGLGASYWRLWWANAVDRAGDGAFAAALPLLAVTLTVRLMGQARLVQGAAVTADAILVAVHHVSIWTLVCAGLCLGSAQVVFDNAAQSVLPSLVPQDLLPRANGTQYVVQVIGGSLLGPPVGGALFALAPVAPFALDAASFAGSVALLTGLPRPQPRADKQGSRETGSAGGVTAGVRWLARHKSRTAGHGHEPGQHDQVRRCRAVEVGSGGRARPRVRRRLRAPF